MRAMEAWLVSYSSRFGGGERGHRGSFLEWRDPRYALSLHFSLYEHCASNTHFSNGTFIQVRYKYSCMIPFLPLAS